MFREVISTAYWSKEIWDDYWSVISSQKQTYLFSHLLPIYVFFIIVSTDDVMMSQDYESYLWRHFHSKFYSIYFERENIRQNNPLEQNKNRPLVGQKWPLDGAISIIIAIFDLETNNTLKI